MEEKIIIQSKQYNFKRSGRMLLFFAVGLILVAWVTHSRSHIGMTTSLIKAMYTHWFRYPCLTAYAGILLLLITLFLLWWLGSYTLTVTNMRIYGKTSFGKRVDLPVDSISSVATNKFNGIAIATASGRIIFGLIKNRDEIHAEITKLIVSRQQAKNPASSGTADELKKYKELLDTGIITQEEFDAKKKQLLEI